MERRGLAVERKKGIERKKGTFYFLAKK